MMKERIAILIAAMACVAWGGGTNRLDTGWISLFDGATLEGWEVKCKDQDKDKEYWKAENGSIVARVPEGSRHHYIWLMTVDEYDDFELKLKIQTHADDTGNSGIQVRSRYDDRAGWLDGPQVDIHPPGPWRNGFIYDETREVKKWISPITGPPRAARPEHAPEGWKWSHAGGDDLWNDVHIICRGTAIKTFINGVPVVDYDGAGYLDDEVHRARNVGMKGHIFLQIHPGGTMDIRFKDIRLKKL
jgi:hypothetical protein